MSHVIYQWVTSHINESRHTFQRVMSLVRINHTHHGVFSDNSSPRTGREPKATPARHKHPQHQHKPKNEIEQTPCWWHIGCGANDFLCTGKYSRKSVRSIYCTMYHVSLLYKITTQIQEFFVHWRIFSNVSSLNLLHNVPCTFTISNHYTPDIRELFVHWRIFSKVSHVMYESFISRMNESCDISMSHVTYQWVMSHSHDFVCTGGYSRKSVAQWRHTDQHKPQCVAVCCSVLQYVAVRCSTLQCVVVWCNYRNSGA